MDTAPDPAEPSMVEFYQSRADQLDAQILAWGRPMGWLLALRGMLLIAVLVGIALTMATLQWWAVVIALVAIPAFIYVAYRHESYERLRRVASIRRQDDLHSVARLKRDWAQLPVVKTKIPDKYRALANDLDLFGRASVFQWLCVAKTPMGIQFFRDWLLHPAEPDEVKRRQEGVKDISGSLDFMDELQLKAQLLSASRNGPREFVDWAESPRWLEQRPWLTWTARILAAVMLLVLFALGFGWVDKTVGGVIVTACLVANFIITMWYAGRIHDIFNSVAAKQADVMHYRRLFEHASSVSGNSEYVEGIRKGLMEGRRPAIDSIAELTLVMAMANLRRAGFFGLLYLFVQFMFLWDIHWLDRLERWHKRHGSHVRGWFETLGRLEAVMCLAKLAHDQADWKFPTVVSTQSDIAQVDAKQLGHPLLSDSIRVCNSVQVGPPGTVLLVTGSNMSGKSTLLRSIGANLVLAQAGSVVCAEELTLPSVVLATSMRIHDSLADGVSFYMAELKRLKEVVDDARDRHRSGGPKLFYLLDEILQGTNSRERHVAVSRVVHHLVESGAIGAVSTHDLELVNAPGLAGQCHAVHFRESFVQEDGRDRMVFDYCMHPGVATTTNALKLLQMVGLDEEIGSTENDKSDSATSMEEESR